MYLGRVRVEYRYSGHHGHDGCFGLNTLVTTENGVQKPMRDLKIGDSVVSDEKGSLTKFVGWMEFSSNTETDFIEIKTVDGEELTLTRNHIVFYYNNSKATEIYAKYLTPGMELVGGFGQVDKIILFFEYKLKCKLKSKVIRRMKYVTKTGYLDPLTASGTILSNNITTSCCKYVRNMTLINIVLLFRCILSTSFGQHCFITC